MVTQHEESVAIRLYYHTERKDEDLLNWTLMTKGRILRSLTWDRYGIGKAFEAR